MSKTKLFSSFSPRLAFSLLSLFCFAALAYAYYAQFVDHVEPCPLCIAQRIIFAAIFVIAVLAAIHNSSTLGNRIYSIISLAIAGFGIKTAAHHVWLQQLPPEQWPASCGMPLEVLYHHIPLTGFIKTILDGSAECAQVNWTVFAIPGSWLSLLGFSLCAILSLLICCKPQRKQD